MYANTPTSMASFLGFISSINSRVSTDSPSQDLFRWCLHARIIKTVSHHITSPIQKSKSHAVKVILKKCVCNIFVGSWANMQQHQNWLSVSFGPSWWMNYSTCLQIIARMSSSCAFLNRLNEPHLSEGWNVLSRENADSVGVTNKRITCILLLDHIRWRTKPALEYKCIILYIIMYNSTVSPSLPNLRLAWEIVSSWKCHKHAGATC